MTVRLEKPTLEMLPGYVAALERGWGPDNLRPEASGREELEKIARNPAAFVASLDDVDARGEPITRPDGSKVARLPGYNRWIWHDEFCGSINFRWQRGTSELPPHVLGHIGYSIVPWQQGRGFAKAGLALLLCDGTRTCRADHRRRQSGVAARDSRQWRLSDRALPQAP